MVASGSAPPRNWPARISLGLLAIATCAAAVGLVSLVTMPLARGWDNLGRGIFTMLCIGAAFLLGGFGLAAGLAGLFRRIWRRRSAWALAWNAALIALLGAALHLHGSWIEARRRDEEVVRRALLAPPDLLREALFDARSPLEERRRRAEDALARGASIDDRLANGWTSLMLTVCGMDAQSVRLTLDLGADVRLATRIPCPARAAADCPIRGRLCASIARVLP